MNRDCGGDALAGDPEQSVGGNLPDGGEQRRRRLRLPPVWLMVIVAGLLAVAALFLHFWLPWRQQVAVLREIASLGGSWSVIGPGPDWVRRWCGYSPPGATPVGPLDNVTRVNLSRGNRLSRVPGDLNPALIERLQVFPALHALDLSYSNITDDWMPQVSQLTTLKELDLSHCRVSGRGFGCLRRLINLEGIDLTYCPMSDDHLEHLARIPSLKYVGLVYCSRLTTAGAVKFLDVRPDLQVGFYGLRDIQAELRSKGYPMSSTGWVPARPP